MQLPPKCKQVETHHEAVQYGQYFKEEDWSAYSKNNSMIMTSMMLYLSRSSAVDEEVEEYSHTQVRNLAVT
ncbi:Oidioi.mRNA.OKI2018_I69.chr2.g6957.t1.cds [Oikopleura dioica]|uniref:Oidioi.mRNA.OKI2018_I69.chr2.g6957.t1.cds n=1 Tax=Oikopleura dioica TaxID=34765 RepID=A0ABN7TDU8_OIKDI|nr:Oidioi.mRNA.OKI2018_I69.chr2.g6957.t1.cds [Oikopleura dioica]